MLKTIINSVRTGRPLKIIYLADSGAISQRMIRVIACNEQYVRAFCYKKQHYRTFKTSHILAVQIENQEIRGHVS